MKCTEWMTRLAVLLLLALQLAAARGEPMIVQNGEPRAAIVIAPQPTRAQKFAARELQSFIEQMSGARLPITTQPDAALPVTIYVGRSSFTDNLGLSAEQLHSDGFRIKSGPEYLVLLGQDDDHVFTEPFAHSPADQQRVLQEWDKITGQTWANPMLNAHRQYSPDFDLWDLDSRGSLNAVYHLLRELGMRWYFPGKIGQVIPQRQDLPLPQLDQTVVPDFAIRHMFIYWSEFFIADPSFTRSDDVRWMLWLGLRQKQHEWGNAGGHGLVAVTARPEVRQKHPEFYALWGGERAFETAQYGAQCLSSQGLFEHFLGYARAIYDHYGEPMVSTGPGDSYVSVCQCPLCEDKPTPQRGWSGQLSDYVWSFADRVARELYTTHPDRWVSCISYSTYVLPPQSIEQFSPNVAAILCRWRSTMGDPASRKEFHDLLSAWQQKLPSKRIYLWDYYLHGRPGSKFEGVPVYFPHAIADDLKHLKGISRGEYIEVYGDRGADPQRPWHEMATMHLNCYVTARLWWDADQDVEALLADYYEQFYGPAREPMKAFVEYAEANWLHLHRDVRIIDRLFELLAAAQQAAGEQGVYRQRVDLVTQYVQRLHQLRDRLAKGRGDNLKVRALPRGKPGQRQIALDGKLDDPFWKGVPEHSLVDLQTGAAPGYPATLKVAWLDDDLYVAMHCADVPGRQINSAGRAHDDTNIWQGDVVEILLETQVRDYYQIVVSPSGHVVDLDRSAGFGMSWTSNAEVATTRGDDGWTLEVRIPIVAEGQADVDPLNGVAGRRPHPAYPWYFNVCRQRLSEQGKELTALAPTGKPDFHEPAKFAELTVP